MTKYKKGDWIKWTGLPITGQILEVRETFYDLKTYYHGEKPMFSTTEDINVDDYTTPFTITDKLERL